MKQRLTLRCCISVGMASFAVSSLFLGAASPTFAGQGKDARRPLVSKPCTPSELSATLALTGLGSAPSTLAGAVLFRNASSGACSLKGVPTVGVISASGQVIPVTQAPMHLRHIKPVALSSSPSSASAAPAGASITFSGWGCPTGSFALVVRFSGWTQSITVPYGSTSGYAGTPCTGVDTTIYIGPVARADTPA
jgi:hypothetical protein